MYSASGRRHGPVGLGQCMVQAPVGADVFAGIPPGDWGALQLAFNEAMGYDPQTTALSRTPRTPDGCEIVGAVPAPPGTGFQTNSTRYREWLAEIWGPGPAATALSQVSGPLPGFQTWTTLIGRGFLSPSLSIITMMDSVSVEGYTAPGYVGEEIPAELFGQEPGPFEPGRPAPELDPDVIALYPELANGGGGGGGGGAPGPGGDGGDDFDVTAAGFGSNIGWLLMVGLIVAVTLGSSGSRR